MGGDVGVFPHGENALELELMVEYGLPVMDALKAVTSVNSKAFHLDSQLGYLKDGFTADLVIVAGDPSKNISDLRKTKFVMKEGVVYRSEK